MWNLGSQDPNFLQVYLPLLPVSFHFSLFLPVYFSTSSSGCVFFFQFFCFFLFRLVFQLQEHTNQSYQSSSPSRHCLIHEFGDLDMPLALAQLGHVQEHSQGLQWNSGSPVELKLSSSANGTKVLQWNSRGSTVYTRVTSVISSSLLQSPVCAHFESNWVYPNL